MPSTTLPAAATGLPPTTPTRRAALAALAGVGAALSLPKAARAMPAASATVAELSRLHALAAARVDAASQACEAADDRVAYPEPPEALFRVRDDFKFFGGFAGSRHKSGRFWYGTEETISQLRTMPCERNDGSGRWSDMATRHNEIMVAWDDWQTDRKAAEDRAGVTAASAEFHEAWREIEALRRRIIDLRSLAPDVLRLKAVAALAQVTPQGVEWYMNTHLTEYGADEDVIALSVLRDMLAAYPVGGAA